MPEINTHRTKSLIQSQIPQTLKAKRTRGSLLIALLAAGLSNHPCHANHNDSREIEIFQCGSLGRVILTSSSDKAELAINSKSLITTGVIHSFMGGNDRIFTKSQSDNFRNPDETTERNPLTLRIISGYTYGKEREQITIHTLDEANTCIRESQQIRHQLRFISRNSSKQPRQIDALSTIKKPFS